MRSLIGQLFIALLLLSLPAQAGDLVTSGTAAGGPDVDAVWLCSVPRLSLPVTNPLFSTQVDRTSASMDSSELGSDRRWTSSAEYRWNADVNRTMDHVFRPPNAIKVFVTQTREDVHDGFEHNYEPNSTLGAIELKIHV